MPYEINVSCLEYSCCTFRHIQRPQYAAFVSTFQFHLDQPHSTPPITVLNHPLSRHHSPFRLRLILPSAVVYKGNSWLYGNYCFWTMVRLLTLFLAPHQPFRCETFPKLWPLGSSYSSYIRPCGFIKHAIIQTWACWSLLSSHHPLMVQVQHVVLPSLYVSKFGGVTVA